MSKNRRIKPYARPTSFDYNVRFDIRHYQEVKYGRVDNVILGASGRDEHYNVKEGELLVRLDSAKAYNGRDLHCFSFANGLSLSGTSLGDRGRPIGDSAHKQLLESLQYVGVAVTEFHPSRDVYEQGFVATIAGLNTLFNNGTQVIYPGQLIACDVPLGLQGAKYQRALQGGIPKEKQQFVVKPFDTLKDELGPEGAEVAAKMIIGTAISYARPGDNVDVILHRCNVLGLGGVGGVGGVSVDDGADDTQNSSDKLLKSKNNTAQSSAVQEALGEKPSKKQKKRK